MGAADQRKHAPRLKACRLAEVDLESVFCQELAKNVVSPAEAHHLHWIGAWPRSRRRRRAARRSASCRIPNVAASGPRSVRRGHGLHIAPSLPKPPAFPQWQDAPEIVQAGEATVFEVTVRYESATQIRDVAQKTAFLHVLGRFEYVDVFQQTHERAFVFVYDVDAETFHPPVDALGYNYET